MAQNGRNVLHIRRVERAADSQLHGASALFPDRGAEAVELVGVARAGDLPRTVIVDRPDLAELRADGLDRRSVKLERGGHAAGMQRRLLGHGFAAQEHEAEGVLDPGLAHGLRDGKIGQKQGGLGVLRAAQLGRIAGEAQLRDAGAEALAEVENGLGGAARGVKIPPHADGLRALSGE